MGDVLITSAGDFLKTSIGDVPWRYIVTYRTVLGLPKDVTLERPQDVIFQRPKEGIGEVGRGRP